MYVCMNVGREDKDMAGRFLSAVLALLRAGILSDQRLLLTWLTDVCRSYALSFDVCMYVCMYESYRTTDGLYVCMYRAC